VGFDSDVSSWGYGCCRIGRKGEPDLVGKVQVWAHYFPRLRVVGPCTVANVIRKLGEQTSGRCKTTFLVHRQRGMPGGNTSGGTTKSETTIGGSEGLANSAYEICVSVNEAPRRPLGNLKNRSKHLKQNLFTTRTKTSRWRAAQF